MALEPRTLTYIRHAQQTTHRQVDPPLLSVPVPLDIPFDCIVTSPYLRCRRTAEGINTRGVPIYVDIRISEFQGHKKMKSTPMHPDSLFFGPVPSFDETWAECEHRLNQHWEYIQSQPGNILVVSHGIIVNYMHEKIIGTKLHKRGRDVQFNTGFSIRL